MICSNKEYQIIYLYRKNPAWRDLFLSYLAFDNNLSITKLKNIFTLIIKYKFIFGNLISDAESFF